MDTEYLTDGMEMIAEYNGATLLRRYVYGAGVDERIAMVDEPAGAITFYHSDRLGSTVALSDTSGDLTDGPFTYSAYGETGLEGQSGNPYRYTGRYLDAETNLYYYRARYYSPSLGRFLQTDPIGIADQINLYAYVGNDPLNAIDPSGEADIKIKRNVNFMAGVGGSAVAVNKGGEASGGAFVELMMVVLTTDDGTEIMPLVGMPTDLGFFKTESEFVAGANLSADAFVGTFNGELDEGTVGNVNFTAAGASFTGMIDPETNELLGLTIGVGPGLPGASLTTSETEVFSIGTLFNAIGEWLGLKEPEEVPE